jgi:single-strand DNA-binding protein
MQVQGTIVRLFPIEEVNGYKNRKVWLKTSDAKYPQTLEMEMTNKVAESFDTFAKVGDSVLMHLNLRGKQYTTKDGVDKVFNIIQVWKVEQVALHQANSTVTPIDVEIMDDEDFDF